MRHHCYSIPITWMEKESMHSYDCFDGNGGGRGSSLYWYMRLRGDGRIYFEYIEGMHEMQYGHGWGGSGNGDGGNLP